MGLYSGCVISMWIEFNYGMGRHARRALDQRRPGKGFYVCMPCYPGAGGIVAAAMLVGKAMSGGGHREFGRHVIDLRVTLIANVEGGERGQAFRSRYDPVAPGPAACGPYGL